jgi:hypothetical protein
MTYPNPTNKIVHLEAYRARRCRKARPLEWDGSAVLYSLRFRVTVRNTRELVLLCEKHHLEPDALGLVQTDAEWWSSNVEHGYPVRIPSRLLCVYFSA